MRHSLSSKARRRGGIFIYMTILMVVMIALASLAVDVGHVQVTKTELRRALDAAALYGARGVTDGTAIAKAQSAASSNSVDGNALSLSTSEISTGTWNTSSLTFSAGGSSPNSVKVTTSRTVSMHFARAIGFNTCTVTAQAIALNKPGGYGVVGLNYIKMGGNSSDSYWSSSGYSSGGNKGSIASNGDISLTGSSYVHGDAWPGVGKSVNDPTKVGGTSTALNSPLNYPPASAGSYATTNDNSQLPSNIVTNTGGTNLSVGNKKATIPAGTYYINDISMGANGMLTLSGPVVFYVYGSINSTGGFVTNGNLPKNLQIYMVSDTSGNAPGSVTLGGNSALYANIYAPQSAFSMAGTGDFYGQLVALSIDMTGTSQIHYDLDLTGPGGITLVD